MGLRAKIISVDKFVQSDMDGPKNVLSNFILTFRGEDNYGPDLNKTACD